MVLPATALLDTWLAARLTDAQGSWLSGSTTSAELHGATAAFLLAFSTASRKVGGSDLSLSPDELRTAAATRPGLDPSHWSLHQTVRTRLVLALPSADGPAYVSVLDRLFADADLGELCALYQALPLLPHPPLHRPRAAEGIRTNMKAVFEAIALRNPYPADELDELPWNQLVLKCLFVGSPLHRVVGLDRRANPQLASMLSAYAHERWAAGRKVSPELWRCIGPFATGALLADLERVLSTGTDAERAAVALSASGNADASGLLETHRTTVDRAIAMFPTWEAAADG